MTAERLRLSVACFRGDEGQSKKAWWGMVGGAGEGSQSRLFLYHKAQSWWVGKRALALGDRYR